MNSRLLIDAIMRQTTVLVAQLSTAAGVRAPLAQFADQVFLSLSREIEAQGVARKVVADMFGMALRGYQKKTQRLAESNSQQGRTLFEAVLDFIEKHQGATRGMILARFQLDGERETVGVLADLVGSGLVYCAGTGSATIYGLTSEAERQRLTRESTQASLAGMMWGLIYRSPNTTRTALAQALDTNEERIEPALEQLRADGRVRQHPDGSLSAQGFQIAAGDEQGWEGAVFDHFQAVATAIAHKLKVRGGGDPRGNWVGGTTLRFELSDAHPHRDEVLGLLRAVRTQLNHVWNQVSDHNDSHPIPEHERFDVVFYFGQDVVGDVANELGMPLSTGDER